MTVEELKKRKVSFESDLDHILNTFFADTGCKISKVEALDNVVYTNKDRISYVIRTRVEI